MTVWVALLRGVNVGGHRRVPMADWRAALEARGCTDVRTHLNSGNAVLATDERDVAGLVAASTEDLGVRCEVVVRTAAEVADVVRRNPWPDRTDEPTKLNVGFLSAPGDGEVRGAAEAEEVRWDGGEVWVWYGGGQARTKLALDVGDRVLTVRNWRTVEALARLSS